MTIKLMIKTGTAGQEISALHKQLDACRELHSQQNEDIILLQEEQKHITKIKEHLEYRILQNMGALSNSAGRSRARAEESPYTEAEISKAIQELNRVQDLMSTKLRERLQKAQERCRYLEEQLEAKQKKTQPGDQLLPTSLQLDQGELLPPKRKAEKLPEEEEQDLVQVADADSKLAAFAEDGAGECRAGPLPSLRSHPSISEEKRKAARSRQEQLEETWRQGLPFPQWDRAVTTTWLEVCIRMPPWFVDRFWASRMNGSDLTSLTDAELQAELRLRNPLHVLKLSLAIQEIMIMRNPSTTVLQETNPNQLQRRRKEGASHLISRVLPTIQEYDSQYVPKPLPHEQIPICSEWLDILGLPQYKKYFEESLIDARMLAYLTDGMLYSKLKMRSTFHRNSLKCGIQCLEMVSYDWQALLKRQRQSQSGSKDVLVWSNGRVYNWLLEIGLGHYAHNVYNSGLHGAVIRLQEYFDHTVMAKRLKISKTDTKAHEILKFAINQLKV